MIWISNAQMQTMNHALPMEYGNRCCRYLMSLVARGAHARSCPAGSIWPGTSCVLQPEWIKKAMCWSGDIRRAL